MWTYTYSNELAHHGVKGMKWGVRRKTKAIQRYADRAKRNADMNMDVANDYKKMLDSGYDHYNKTNLTSSDRKELSREYNRFAKAGKKWLQTRQDILSMDINSINVSDVKRRYNSTNAGGWRVG